MFSTVQKTQSLWMWRQEYQHHEQLPVAFNGTWPSWNSDLDNRPCLQIDVEVEDVAAKKEWEAMRKRMMTRAAKELTTRSGLTMEEAVRTVEAEVRSSMIADDADLSDHPAQSHHGTHRHHHHHHDYHLSHQIGQAAFKELSNSHERNKDLDLDDDDDEDGSNGNMPPPSPQHFASYSAGVLHCDQHERHGQIELAQHCRRSLEFGCYDDWKEGNMIRALDNEVTSRLSRALGRRYTVNNPALRLWCDWAEDAEFHSPTDTRLLGSRDGLTGYALRKQVVTKMFSYAIPTARILRMIANDTPKGGLLDVGGYPGYFASMLADMGVDVFVLDPVDDSKPSSSSSSSSSKSSEPLSEVNHHISQVHESVLQKVPDIFYPSLRISCEEYLANNNGSPDKAMLFVWPHNRATGSVWEQKKDDDDDRNTYAHKCLDLYKGDTVFFIGEIDGGVTFDMHKYMQNHKRTWREVDRRLVPTWPGFDDMFFIFKRKKQDEL